MSLESPVVTGTGEGEGEGVGADEARGLSEERGLGLETLIDPLGLWDDETPPIIPIIPVAPPGEEEGWPYAPKDPPDTAE